MTPTLISGADIRIGIVQLIVLVAGLSIANALAPVQRSAAVLEERVASIQRELIELKTRVLDLERTGSRHAARPE